MYDCTSNNGIDFDYMYWKGLYINSAQVLAAVVVVVVVAAAAGRACKLTRMAPQVYFQPAFKCAIHAGKFVRLPRINVNEKKKEIE